MYHTVVSFPDPGGSGNETNNTVHVQCTMCAGYISSRNTVNFERGGDLTNIHAGTGVHMEREKNTKICSIIFLISVGYPMASGVRPRVLLLPTKGIVIPRNHGLTCKLYL